MDDYLDAISRESGQVAELIPNNDLDRPVPACPDWVLGDLLLHLGEVQRFWAENVSAGDITEHWNGERTVPSSNEHIEQ